MGSGIPKVVESRRKGKNYATLHNILQIKKKKCKEAGANKYRTEPRLKGMGRVSSPLK